MQHLISNSREEDVVSLSADEQPQSTAIATHCSQLAFGYIWLAGVVTIRL
ncbi:MAG: hypothetical protein U9N50_10070 [Pseudomonadota bacterium]|nr:hypothetical protein [Pseudomonadota bacterium]